MEIDSNLSIYSAMQDGEPVARFTKAILAKVRVLVLDPFSGKPEEVILKGNPESTEATVELWSTKELQFFKRANSSHFKQGRLKEMEKAVDDLASPNEITDDEIEQILSSKFMTLKNKLETFTSSAPVYRILEAAKKRDASAKLISHIEGKLAEFGLE